MKDGTVTRGRKAHDLIRGIDTQTTTAAVALYSADIRQNTVLPEETAQGCVTRSPSLTRDRTRIIDPVCFSNRASECS